MARGIPIALDIVLTLIFTVIGRLSHARGMSFAGIVETAWPFLVACLVGWGIVSALRTDVFGVRAGVVVWIVTLFGGMALRVATGGTAQIAFFLVAAGFLALFIIGWRLIAKVVLSRRTAVA